MKPTIVITLAALAYALGCTHHDTTAPDAPPYYCASTRGTGCDARIDSAGDARPLDAAACTPWTMPQGCCVFSGSCGSGSDCTWIADGSNAPSQSTGACLADGTVPEGGPCYYNNGNGECAPGLTCAWNNGQIMSGSNAGRGTCRTMCDPQDTTAHGCPTGKTCVGMPVCGPADSFPNCPSDPTVDIGYCL